MYAAFSKNEITANKSDFNRFTSFNKNFFFCQKLKNTKRKEHSQHKRLQITYKCKLLKYVLYSIYGDLTHNLLYLAEQASSVRAVRQGFRTQVRPAASHERRPHARTSSRMRQMRLDVRRSRQPQASHTGETGTMTGL